MKKPQVIETITNKSHTRKKYAYRTTEQMEQHEQEMAGKGWQTNNAIPALLITEFIKHRRNA